MSLKKTINIAIFGLSLRTLNDLKEQVRKAIPSDVNINWTNVSEPNLSALLINDIFFDTPSIQNLIKTNHLTVLKLISKTDKNSIVENNAVHLPILDIHPLQSWLASNVLARPVTPTLLEEQPTKPHHDNTDKQKFLEELINPLNGKIQIFDQNGSLGIADPRAHLFWADPNRLQQNTNHTLNFTYATMSDSIKLAKEKTQDLHFWLWNLLWRSPEYLELAPESGTFKLTYWPQPYADFDRRDILRLSACFAQGASIQLVASHLNIPEPRVRQFIAACLGLNFAIAISDNKAKFNPQKPNATPTEETGAIRRFFGGLRRRLGF